MTRLPRRLRRCKRPGLSLLEVVISMAILLFSIVAIMQLVSMGTDRAINVQQQAIGSMLAERKLAEAMSGAMPLGSSSYTSFSDDGMEDWQWKMEASQNSINGLWNVEVSVKYEPPQGGSSGMVVQLGQMILDPTLRGSTLDTPPVQNLNYSNVPTGNGSSSNNQSGGGGGGGPTPGGGAAPAPKAGGAGGASGKTGGTPAAGGRGGAAPAAGGRGGGGAGAGGGGGAGAGGGGGAGAGGGGGAGAGGGGGRGGAGTGGGKGG